MNSIQKNTSFQSQGRLISFNKPHVMGILNVTPDSFFDGGRYDDPGAIKDRISQMLDEGADSIDIGGMSTKPGAASVNLEEEWNRIEQPITEALSQKAIVSIDTVKAEIARRAIDMGVHIINDISAGELDKDMLSVVGQSQSIYVAMHMQGKPSNMQENPQYQSVTLDILNYFAQRINVIKSFGINQVILDPGFGFGKTIEHNYSLLNHLSSFGLFDCPILVGISRKSMIYKVIESTPENALPATLGLTMAALIQGVQILRVHDIAETVQVVKVFNQMQSNLT
jgi:dihydropteroate synthase